VPTAFGRITAAAEVIYPRYDPNTLVGRAWLRKEVEQFCKRPDERHLIIVGEPGSGKSSFLAYLAETWNCPRHFIRVDNVGGVTGVSPRAFLVSLGAQLYEKYGPDIFQRPDSEDVDVQAGWTKDEAVVVGRFVDSLFTLPFLPVRKRKVKVKALAATGKSQVIGERIRSLVDVTEAMDELTLLHAAVLNPLLKLHALHPNEIVVVLIDALDEAEQHAGKRITDVIPRATDASFPPNLRLVMTSRPGNHLLKFRPKDLLHFSDSEPGYRDLSKDSERGYRDLSKSDIEKFIRQDIAEFIQQRLSQDPFAVVVNTWPVSCRDGFQTKLADAGDGNFLYLYHFFKQAEENIRTGRAKLEDMAIPKDLDDIYRVFAVDKIKADIRLGDWVNLYLPLLGTLAVIREPVGRDLLAGFAGVLVDYADYITSQLKQFLDEHPSPEGFRYRLYHRSFREYLLDSTRNKDYPLDGARYHRQIASYYRGDKKTWQDVEWRSNQRSYALRHLTVHLSEVRAYQELFDLLETKNWYQAQIENDSSGSAFLTDLAQAFAGAETINTQAIQAGESPPLLGREVRIALATASTHGLSENIQPSLITALLQENIWSPEQAVASARSNPDPVARADALRTLSERMGEAERETLLREALFSVLSLDPTEWQRPDVLRRLVPALTAPLLELALEAADAVDRSRNRANELAMIVPFLPQPRQAAIARKAIALLTESDWGIDRAGIWETMVESWTGPLKEEVLAAALDDIRAIPEGEEWRARSITSLAKAATGPTQDELLLEALEATLKIETHDAQGETLSGRTWTWTQGKTLAFNDLIPLLSEPLLRQALVAAQEIESDGDRSEVMSKIVPRLAQEGDITEALRVAKLVNDQDQVRALVELAPFLTEPKYIEAALLLIPSRDGHPHSWSLMALSVQLAKLGEWQAALDKARTIEWPRHRLDGLAGIVTSMPSPLTEELIGEVLDVASQHSVQQNLDNFEMAEQPLLVLALRLADEGLVDKALAAARAFPPGPRVEALTRVAERLKNPARSETLREALATARFIGDARERVTSITELLGQAPQLSAEQIQPVIQAALSVVPMIKEEKEQVGALERLAVFIPPSLLNEALILAQAIKRPLLRLQALVALAPHFPIPERQKLLDEAAKISETVKWSRRDAIVFVEMVAQFPDERQQNALSWAIENQIDWALVGFARRLPEPLALQAIAGMQTLGKPGARISGLCQVASQLPEDLLHEILAEIGNSEDDRARARLLQRLAPTLNESMLEQAVGLAQKLRDYDDWVETLATLLPRWAELGHAQEALDVLAQMDWSAANLIGHQVSLRAQILGKILPNLAERDRAAALEEAIENIQKLDRKFMFAAAIASLAPQLLDSGNHQLVKDALTATMNNQDWEERAEALQLLAAGLPASLLPEAMKIASELPGTIYLYLSPRAVALTALVNRLLATLTPASLYPIWRDALSKVSKSARSDLLWDLPALCPLMAGLGCASAPIEMAEAITEAARRWP
jgi:hypothetical protein